MTTFNADPSSDLPTAWTLTEDVEPTVESEAVDISSNRVTRIVYGVIGSMGILGNLTVILVFLSSRILRSKIPNMYIISQCFIDLGTSVFLVASSTIQDNHVPNKGLSAVMYCQLWLTKVILWGFLVSSTWNLVALTVERYLEVVHPVWHKMMFDRTKVVVSLALAWGIGFIFNASYMIPSTTLHADGQCAVYSKWPSNVAQKAIGIFTVVLQYISPLIIMIVCYSRIAIVIRRKIHPSQPPQPTPSTSTAPSMHRDRKWVRARNNTVKTLALVGACFVFCWSWNQVYYLMFNFGLPLNLSSDFYHFTVVAVFLNCCLNPVVYAFKYEQFQSQFKKLFSRHHRQPTGTHGNSSGSDSVHATKQS